MLCTHKKSPNSDSKLSVMTRSVARDGVAPNSTRLLSNYQTFRLNLSIVNQQAIPCNPLRW